jgi:hypothetical protein
MADHIHRKHGKFTNRNNLNLPSFWKFLRINAKEKKCPEFYDFVDCIATQVSIPQFTDGCGAVVTLNAKKSSKQN